LLALSVIVICLPSADTLLTLPFIISAALADGARATTTARARTTTTHFGIHSMDQPPKSETTHGDVPHREARVAANRMRESRVELRAAPCRPACKRLPPFSIQGQMTGPGELNGEYGRV